MFLSHNLPMKLPFSNRRLELKELDTAAADGGLVVIFGRRRVGKTRLLVRWLAKRKGLYSQAIEAARAQQLDQVFQDIRDQLATTIVPKSWGELFELLDLQKKKRWVFCLDEFPYLVASDPTLPSVLQRWLDHSGAQRSLLLLSGSSTRTMNGLFLNRSAPLYGRARKLLHVEPMSYAAFCTACRRQPADQESFNVFSLVGGVPKYWEFVRPRQTAVALAEELFFGFAPYLDQEPARVLRDENIAGVTASAVLESIGRGAEKPSEIAARVGTAQTNLTRLLQQLLDASLIKRELPFGESMRSTKRSLYRIQDPTMRFWFRVYSPHRTRWHQYSLSEKTKLVRDHASTVFEDFYRGLFPGASRYWEANLEFDSVREAPGTAGASRLIVSEVKWTVLSVADRATLSTRLAECWARSALQGRYKKVDFEVIDATELNTMKRDRSSKLPASS
jgi:AAA+ ATPase superfamily predicted ATPase